MGFKEIEKQVIALYKLKKGDLYLKTRRPSIVEARSVLCYWAVRKLHLTCTTVAKHLNLTQPAVSYAVVRGEKIVEDKSLIIEIL